MSIMQKDIFMLVNENNHYNNMSDNSTKQSQEELMRRVTETLAKTDKFIEETEKTLDQFEKDDQEWRRRGRDLGFDF